MGFIGHHTSCTLRQASQSSAAPDEAALLGGQAPISCLSRSCTSGAASPLSAAAHHQLPLKQLCSRLVEHIISCPTSSYVPG